MDDVVHEKVAGLDIHEKTIVACVLYTPDGKIRPKKEFSTFPTTTKGLLKLSDRRCRDYSQNNTRKCLFNTKTKNSRADGCT